MTSKHWLLNISCLKLISVSQAELERLQTEKKNGQSSDDPSESAETTPESAETTPESAETTPESAETTLQSAQTTPELAETTPQRSESSAVVSIVTASGVQREYLYDYTQWFCPVIADDGVTYYQSTEGHVGEL